MPLLRIVEDRWAAGQRARYSTFWDGAAPPYEKRQPSSITAHQSYLDRQRQFSPSASAVSSIVTANHFFNILSKWTDQLVAYCHPRLGFSAIIWDQGFERPINCQLTSETGTVTPGTHRKGGEQSDDLLLLGQNLRVYLQNIFRIDKSCCFLAVMTGSPK